MIFLGHLSYLTSYSLGGFGPQVEAKLAPRWSQVGPMLHPKWIQKTIKKNDHLLARQLGPTWPQLGPNLPKLGPNSPKLGLNPVCAIYMYEQRRIYIYGYANVSDMHLAWSSFVCCSTQHLRCRSAAPAMHNCIDACSMVQAKRRGRRWLAPWAS